MSSGITLFTVFLPTLDDLQFQKIRKQFTAGTLTEPAGVCTTSETAVLAAPSHHLLFPPVQPLPSPWQRWFMWLRRVWEGKSGRRGGSEAGSRGEKLVYQRGLIMETRRKPLRRIFHDVAQEPWHTETHTLSECSTSYPPPLIPHRQAHPLPSVCHVIQQLKRCDNVVLCNLLRLSSLFSNGIIIFVTTFPLLSSSGCTCCSWGSFASLSQPTGWNEEKGWILPQHFQLASDRAWKTFNHQSKREGKGKRREKVWGVQ